MPFAGDLLTAVRAREVQNIRVNSQSFQASLRGLKPFACDWHAKVNYNIYVGKVCVCTYVRVCVRVCVHVCVC